MVKKRVGGAHRYKSVQKSGSSQSPGHEQQKQKHKQQQDAGPKPPSHLQRKITKSVKFYEKVLSQSAPKAPQGVQKRKKKPAKTIASLDSLAAELNHITTSAAAAAAAAAGGSAADAQLSELQQARLLAGKGTESSIKRSKARLAMGVTESARLQRVLQHPAYKADPIQAVMNHLLNTLPAAPQPQQQQGQQQQQRKKQKKKQGSGSRGADDMQQ